MWSSLPWTFLGFETDPISTGQDAMLYSSREIRVATSPVTLSTTVRRLEVEHLQQKKADKKSVCSL